MSEETLWRGTAKDLREPPRSPGTGPAGAAPEIYEFGPFRLEPAEHRLTRGAEAVPLTPKAFDTLYFLVRDSGHLVEKDELIRMLWPHSFVEEGSLTNNIFLLRKALGEDPQYIETVPRKGYRFISAVRRLPTAERARAEKARLRTGCVRSGSRQTSCWCPVLPRLRVLRLPDALAAVGPQRLR